ncbi:Uncharacterized protein TCM_043546 [Theobroma cacao]|uniref:Uncharacterized protein n=1 Tax=Theobroma cacao TaxID=3641 RepID=A0A061FQN3_THECC|nr:Uncharacterized protein TCM_043546 [Theobroma cacao]
MQDLITVAHWGDTEVDAKPCGVSIDIRGNECLSGCRDVVMGLMGVPGRDMKYRLNEKTPMQKDSHNCGDWVVAALQSLIGSDHQTLKANAIEGIRTKFALKIFANSSSC